MPTVARLKNGDLLLKDEVDEHIPPVASGLVAHFPMDENVFDIIGGNLPDQKLESGRNLMEMFHLDWRDPVNWTMVSGSTGANMTWDPVEQALIVDGTSYWVFKGFIKVDPTRKWYGEVTVKRTAGSVGTFYCGDKAYKDDKSTSAPQHPGTYEYFVAIGATANPTWTTYKNSGIGGAPRTGTGTDINNRAIFDPEVAYIQPMIIANYNTGVAGTDKTGFKDFKYYYADANDPITITSQGISCEDATTNIVDTTKYATGMLAIVNGWGGFTSTIDYPVMLNPIGSPTVAHVKLSYDQTTTPTGGTNFGVAAGIDNDTYIAITPSTTYTFSYYIKALRSTYFHTNLVYVYQYPGTTAAPGATLGGAGYASLAQREDVGDGWYRIWGTFTTQATANTIRICPHTYDTNASGNEIWFCGGQLEAGRTYPTSLVRGSRSNKSYLTFPATSYKTLFGNEGAILVKYKPQSTDTAGNYPYIISAGAYTNSPITKDWIGIFRGTGWNSDGIHFALHDGSLAKMTRGDYSITGINAMIGQSLYLGISWSLAQMKVRIWAYNMDTKTMLLDGDFNIAAGDFDGFTSFDRFNIGTQSGIDAQNAVISNVSIYNRLLSVDEFKKNAVGAMEITQTGRLVTKQLSEASVYPTTIDGAVYFPLGQTGQNDSRTVSPLQEVNTVYRDGAVWLGQAMTNYYGGAPMNIWGGTVTSVPTMTIEGRSVWQLGSDGIKGGCLMNNQGTLQLAPNAYATTSAWVKRNDSTVVPNWYLQGQTYDGVSVWTSRDPLGGPYINTIYEIWIDEDGNTFGSWPNDTKWYQHIRTIKNTHTYDVRITNLFYLVGSGWTSGTMYISAFQLEAGQAASPYAVSSRGYSRLNYNAKQLLPNGGWGQFSIIYKVKYAAVNDGVYHLSGAWGRWYLGISTTGGFMTSWMGGSPAAQKSLGGNSYPIANQWVTIGATFNPGVEIALYYNGAKVASNVDTANNTMTDPITAAMELNSINSSDTSYPLNAWVKDLLIVPSILTPAQMNAAHNVQMRDSVNGVQIQGVVKERVL